MTEPQAVYERTWPCVGCGRPIFFALVGDESGSDGLALDIEPDPKGTVVVDAWGPQIGIHGSAANEDTAKEPRYRPHSCGQRR